jgi:hypothetical protein
VIDDLKKEAFFKELWEKAKDLFGGEKRRSKRRAEYHFSPKAGTEKWKGFPRNASSKEFVKRIQAHPDADPKLKMHVQSLHDLSKGKTVAKIQSSSGAGKKYEVRKLKGGGVGCTCSDWRYKGSVTPGYECKHIRAAKAGLTKAAALNTTTKAFFDEMRAIERAKDIKVEKDRAKRNERPWSSMLTQEEEPTDYHPQNPAEEEPEVLVRGQGI